MIKSILLFSFVNTFAFFTFFQDNTVNVEQVVPLTLAEGESQEVKVIFEKNAITGFAKYEVEVDPGLEITAGDIGSASFTFEQGIAKFIWFTLPEDNSFSISYFLKNMDGEIGNIKKLNAQFSYLEDNAKKIFNCPEQRITIEQYPNDSLVAIDEIVIDESIDDSEEISLSPEERIEAIKSHVVRIDREFQRIENGLYRMRIKIDKGPIVGFAKLEEVVPDGFDYIEEETNGAIFTKVKGKAKFVWFDVPEKNIVEISYNLKAEEANVVGLHNITGEFTYLIDDQDVKSQSIPAFFQVNSMDLENAIENDAIGSDQEEVIVENEVWKEETLNPGALNTSSSDEEITEEIADQLIEQAEGTGISGMEDESIKKTSAQGTRILDYSEGIDMTEGNAGKASNQNEELNEEIRMLSDADEGISYRVQICATRKLADRGYFKKNKKFIPDVTIENHQGWYKYTTGNHDIYQSARNSREEINGSYDFDGPFVAAYNDGERISVQEALMISNQQWFK
ncbi:MAG: hypothetical protein AAF487_13160 [Bacteroidota bacterium]